MTPSVIRVLSQPVVSVYETLTIDLMRNIARTLNTYNEITSTNEWRLKKLAQLGQLDDANVKTIAHMTKNAPELIRVMLERAAGGAIDEIEPGLRNAAKKGYLDSAVEIPVSKNIIQTLTQFQNQARDTLNLVNTVMRYKARDAYSGIVNKAADIVNREEYLAVLGKHTASVATGIEARQSALRKCIKEFSEKGIPGFVDKAGREWSPEAYLNMDIRTTINNTAHEAQFARMKDYGNDIVEVSSHAGARKKCYPYQARLFSLSNKSGYVRDLDGKQIHFSPWRSTSYGEPDGLLGINCGHRIDAFIPGFSKQTYRQYPKKESEQIYAESQKQRYLERQVRASKYECVMLSKMDDKEGFQKASSRLKTRQQALNQFTSNTGGTRRQDREQVFGFNRSIAQKTNRAAKAEIEKYSKIHYNTDGTIIVTDDWTSKKHAHLPNTYKPNAVIDTVSMGGKQRDRMIYGDNSKQKTQISNGPHSNPKRHPFGKHGEHAHDIIWKDGEIIGRHTRELTELERKEHADIL